MTTNNSGWIPIKDFLAAKNLSMQTVYHFVKIRAWHPGFVVRKNPTGPRARYVEGNLQHYEEWLNKGHKNERNKSKK
jgi:hypothetical protein